MIKYERIWELLLIFFFFLDAEDNFHILDISFSISGKKIRIRIRSSELNNSRSFLSQCGNYQLWKIVVGEMANA